MADLRRIASKVALTQPLSERPDYGSQDQTAILLSQPGGSIDAVKAVNVKINEYIPINKNSPYPTIDGEFEFILPKGQKCKFVGRLDPNDQTGTMTCDGKDVTNEMFANAGDDITLDFIDETLDPGYFTLDRILEKVIEDLTSRP